MLFCNARAMQVGSSTLHPRATCCHCPTINHLLKTRDQLPEPKAFSTPCCTNPDPRQTVNRARTAPAPAAHRVLRAVGIWLGALWLLLAGPARAQGIDLTAFEVTRSEGALLLDFVAKPGLSKAVEDAMQRGVPIYFVAQATLFRSRWYWRDERVSRVTRTWRLSAALALP